MGHLHGRITKNNRLTKIVIDIVQNCSNACGHYIKSLDKSTRNNGSTTKKVKEGLGVVETSHITHKDVQLSQNGSRFLSADFPYHIAVEMWPDDFPVQALVLQTHLPLV